MSESTEITSFKFELRLDATVSINGENWVKPGVSTSTHWNDVPSPRELEVAKKYMMNKILEPTVSDVVELVSEKVRHLQGN